MRTQPLAPSSVPGSSSSAAAPPPAKPTPSTVPPKPTPGATDSEAKEQAAQSNDDVSGADVTELQDELAKLKKKLGALESSFKQEVERLELEIDEEKKARMTMQVEIDRLKRRN